MSELKTCFKKVDYDLNGLLHYIDLGDIGLPDIQRPFVWPNIKVRDLFDSMYRGFLVGNLLFWENGALSNTRKIGIDGKQRTAPARLIIDGQQRLTSLYAVIRGKKVLDADFKERQIEIAFRPSDGKFAVSDASIKRDPEWISNISTIWTSGDSTRKIGNQIIAQISKKRSLTEAEEETISNNIDRLIDIQKYPFTALEISPTVDEEEVSYIFVRINSQGVNLNQADFILTLLSVFWEEGRRDLEVFCWNSRKAPNNGDPPSPFNHLIQPDPDQLLRVAIAIGFKRGRLKSVYQILRGKDLETESFSPELRGKNFSILKEAQINTLNLTYWHQFLNILVGAGFRTGDLISSKNTIVYSYVFYLIGRLQYNVPEHILQRLIARWFYASSLTGRYTNSPESVMEQDLNRIKNIKDADSFIQSLNDIMTSEMTRDFWAITLPGKLDNSSARSPELYAYMAAQNKMNAPILFSRKMIPSLLDPSIKSKKNPLERHHLFPKGWLVNQKITDLKQINKIANLALLEWPENIEIGDTSPVEYLPKIQERFKDDAILWQQMMDYHALPKGWEHMAYEEFLNERRKLMALIIRRGFEAL